MDSVTLWLLSKVNLAKELLYYEGQANLTATTTFGTIFGPSPSVTLDGNTTVMVEYYCGYYFTNQTNQTLTLYLADSTPQQIAVVGYPMTNSAQAFAPISIKRRYKPAAGTYTWNVQAQTGGGTATLEGGASFPPPMFIRVERVT